MPDNDQPTRFLGKLDPVNRPTLQVGEFLRAREIPDHPRISPPPPANWTMDRNDQAGDCVVAGMNHTLQAVATNLGQPRRPWNDAELLDLYRTQNPNFHDWSQGGTRADGGMVVQTFLEECVRRGHILAFAKIDHENNDLMRAATYIGGGVMTGEILREAHESQDVWDAVTKSPIWGGHCTTTVGFQDGRQQCVTWGQIQPYTDAFAERHMDEAWFVLTQALVNNPSFRNNFDIRGFAEAVADLTNGKVIVPIPPLPPTPAPVAPPADPGPPTPADPAWDDFPFPLMDVWANRGVNRTDPAYETKAKLAYRQWKANHNVDARTASARRAVYDAQGNLVGEVELGSGQFWASQS